jgi:hypothetical protein
MAATPPASEYDEALRAVLRRCEAACAALADACSAASDVAITTRAREADACVGSIMDCWYIGGATCRLLSRHAEYRPKSVAMAVAACKDVTRHAVKQADGATIPAIRAWARAARECALSCTSALGLLWDRALDPIGSWEATAPGIEDVVPEEIGELDERSDAAVRDDGTQRVG